ncbi:GNAT family N-acetyltransferase [Actinospongicola halichondriae]|uniref:GNAT family N-acetyltransferase n=1 Tax=Actinospongicola halichondriae TaxID=3236844 RepID=UPI003D524E7A
MQIEDVTIESLRDGDLAARWDLGRQAFGATAEFDADLPGVSPERAVAAYRGDALAGTVVTIGFTAHWGGAPIPCGGVSGVIVRPEDRGLGLAKAMLAETFDRMRSRGEVIGALFPTTATLYRGTGFEIAGSYETRKIPLALIPATPSTSLTWRRVAFGDPAVREVYETMAPQLDGWMLPGDVWWDRHTHIATTEKGKNRYAYVGSRNGTDVAAVHYHYDESTDRLYELGLDLLAGVDHDAVAAALAFLAGNATTAGHLQTTLPGGLLALHVPHVQQTSIVDDWPWMLRLVDVAGAFAQRRWPSPVAGRVEIDVVDDTIAANAGPHVIEFGDGAASVEPGGAGTVRVKVTDLAAIYAGNDVAMRHRAGRLPGASTDDIDLLAAACTSSASMPYFF